MNLKKNKLKRMHMEQRKNEWKTQKKEGKEVQRNSH